MSWWAAAFQALGSTLTRSSDRRQSSRDQQRSDEQRMRELAMQYGTMRDMEEYQRRNQLEDRRYREEAMGSYGQFSTLPSTVQRPEYTNTTPTPMGNSYAAMLESVTPPKPKANLLRRI